MSGTRRRARWLSEAGTSLVEVMIGLSLVVLVVPVLGSLLTSGGEGAARLQADSEAIDELRTQVFTIQRELRSAICIETPAPGAANAGPMLVFTTAANGTPYRVTYEVAGGELRRTVEGRPTHVAGTSLTSGRFEQIANPRRSVHIQLVVAPTGGGEHTALDTVVAGRNAWETSC
jgi:Tfp pilus assembly protein PilW